MSTLSIKLPMLTIREVGHPIHVVQCDKPTLEEVMHVQQQYIDELMWCVPPLRCFSLPSHPPFSLLGAEPSLIWVHRIWETYKDQFARTRTRELSIIE